MGVLLVRSKRTLLSELLTNVPIKSLGQSHAAHFYCSYVETSGRGSSASVLTKGKKYPRILGYGRLVIGIARWYAWTWCSPMPKVATTAW